MIQNGPEGIRHHAIFSQLFEVCAETQECRSLSTGHGHGARPHSTPRRDGSLETRRQANPESLLGLDERTPEQ